MYYALAMETIAEEKWVDAKALAAHFMQSAQWVRRYAPLIPHVRMGRAYRFRISEADKWFEQWRGGEELS